MRLSLKWQRCDVFELSRIAHLRPWRIVSLSPLYRFFDSSVFETPAQSGPNAVGLLPIGTIILDCPFDARKIPDELLILPSIGNKSQRLTMGVHLVDTATNILHALRLFTLSPNLSLRFLSAVQDQMTDPRSVGPYSTRINAIPLHELAKLAEMEICGT